jgi:hypothetical protein
MEISTTVLLATSQSRTSPCRQYVDDLGYRVSQKHDCFDYEFGV